MKTKVSIAKINIGINTIYDSLFNIDEYLTSNIEDFSIDTKEEDIVEERNISIKECVYEGIEYPNYSKQELENTAVYRKIGNKINEYNAIIFHGSAIGVNEEGYIFAAYSGVGKTTHTNLWLKNIEGSYIINGDKPIIRIIENKIYVCGTPWMGKEKLGTNKMVELKGICFLDRGENNTIEETNFNDVMDRLVAQTYRPSNPDSLLRVMKIIEYIGLHTKLYKLKCNMEDEAALISYNKMVGK